MLGESISRPTSAPLRDNDWDAYLHDRKLVQPPTGVSPPIATRNVGAAAYQRLPVPPAVVEALDQRKRRESALGLRPRRRYTLARLALARTNSTGGHLPVSILPLRSTHRNPRTNTQRPDARRTRTFEELNERHREKLHDLQAPLTQAEKEHAEVEAAKQRWERSKAFERDAVAKRQAAKAAVLEQKRKHSGDELRRPAATTIEARPRHSRSASGDKLAVTGSSAKRTSTMKVEDWQKHQDAEVGVRGDRGAIQAPRLLGVKQVYHSWWQQASVIERTHELFLFLGTFLLWHFGPHNISQHGPSLTISPRTIHSFVVAPQFCGFYSRTEFLAYIHHS
ncbi:substrate transporter [Salix suchowensis]|nr:substrate transporter [Salix suchowensis]